MQENTNKAIAINSMILYVRLAIVSICGLLYTRFGLETLGITDFGLFSVVAGVISFVAIINNIMIATTNRFMAIAIGKGDLTGVNRTFNINLAIHVFIAIFTLLIAYPTGHWYINHYINYAGDMENVYMVFDMSITASIISFIGVPYNGLLLAHERFFVFCTTDVLSSIAKCIFAYILIDHFENKLFLLALSTAILTAYPTLVFLTYCHTRFKEITHIRFVYDIKPYIEVIKFATNMSIGAIAMIAKSQGSALIVNIFFSTIMNSALAIANSVNQIITMFANNIYRSISPQIYKNYANNNLGRTINLVCLSSKITYLTTLMTTLPFLLIPETIFALWLKETPEYTVIFTRILVIDMLIISLNAGIPDLIFATGKVRNYQLIANGLFCSSVLAGYFVLKNSLRAEYLFLTYIPFTIMVFFVRNIIVTKITKFPINRLITEVYRPAIIITVLLFPMYFLTGRISPYFQIMLAEIYFIILTLIIGLSQHEKQLIIKAIKRRLG